VTVGQEHDNGVHVSGVWDIYVLALEGVCYDAIAAACMRPVGPPSGIGSHAGCCPRFERGMAGGRDGDRLLASPDAPPFWLACWRPNGGEEEGWA
jgi:hypothetical protein